MLWCSARATTPDAGPQRRAHIRRCFQITMREDLVNRVEELTGRKVIAFMSDNHIEPDMGVEIFILQPSEPHNV